MGVDDQGLPQQGLDLADFDRWRLEVGNFEALASADSHRPLSGDWWVVVADVARSTQAITEGRYKAVNLVGLSVITTVRNAVRPVEVPYIRPTGASGLRVDHGVHRRHLRSVPRSAGPWPSADSVWRELRRFGVRTKDADWSTYRRDPG